MIQAFPLKHQISQRAFKCFIKINTQFYLRRVSVLIFYTSRFSVGISGPAAVPPKNQLEMQIIRSSPDLLNQELCGQSPLHCVLMCFPRDWCMLKFKNHCFLLLILKGSTCFRDHIHEQRQWLSCETVEAESAILKLKSS